MNLMREKRPVPYRAYFDTRRWVMDLSRRLGNRLGVLPHTVLLDAEGRVIESRIGIYSEAALDSRLAAITGK